MSSYAVRAQLVATARALLSLGLNFSALDSKKNSKPWRVYGQLLLREIGYRHYIDPDQPNTKPYILYEQHLSSIPSHLLRFQNFMAERGIFRHLLSVDWLSRLTTAEYVNISSLLRRIRNEDNVYYSYRNRRDFVRRAGELDVQVQNEVLPIWDISEDTIPGAMLKSRLGLKAFPEALSRALKGIARGAGFVVLLPFIFLIAGALSLIFPFSKSINAWLARMKIGTLMQFDPNATELSALLAQYEAKFSGSAVHVEKMASMATRTEMIPKLISSGWIDHVPLQNRVFITSLFRRLLTNPKIAEQVGHEPVRSAISVLSQSNLPQLKIPNKYQTLERLLFKGVDKKAKSTAKVKPTTALKLKPRPPIPVENTSEQHVKSEGWFQVRGGQFTKFAEMVRNRHYSNAITMCDDANLLGTLEQADLSLLAALRAYHGIPTAVSSHLGRALKGNEKAALLLDRKVMRGEKREHASQLLFPNVGKTQSDLIRSLWVEAETLMQDDDDLAAIGVLEDIAIQYGNIPQNRITSRRISFDTFLITKLGDLLEKAKGWLDFHEENPTVLLAFAHCAVLAGDHDLTKILFGIIEHKTTIKPVFKLGLEEAYLGRGIHGLNTILAQGDLETLVQTPALTRIQDKEKTLCLVETSANVGNLNALKGLSDKVVCAPVQPNDASKFPALVQKLQIEDAIPMYSKEDMDISHEVDKLTEIAVAAVTDQFKDNEDTAQWADFVEVVHATTFFSIYREVMAMKLVEKLTADVKGYDRVVFLLKNGQSLSSFSTLLLSLLAQKTSIFHWKIAANRNSRTASKLYAETIIKMCLRKIKL